MKKIILLSALFSFGVFAQGAGVGTQQGEAFSPNDGLNPPGTFTNPNRAEPIDKKEEQQEHEVQKQEEQERRTPTTNSSGSKPEEQPSDEALKTIKSERVYQTGPYNREGQYAPKTDEQKQAEEERDAHLKELDQEKTDQKEQEEAVQ